MTVLYEDSAVKFDCTADQDRHGYSDITPMILSSKNNNEVIPYTSNWIVYYFLKKFLPTSFLFTQDIS